LGEGSVFIILLGWVSYRTFRAFKKEIELARLQKNFLLSITHEFKSPLASIKLYLETINRHDLDKAKQQQFIRSAILDTERLNILVENALLANLIEHEGHFFANERVDLSELFSGIIRNFENVPGNPPVRSDIKADLHLNGDKNALTTLLNNLLENAAKYSPKDSPIEVSLFRKDNALKLTVADYGIGIPDHEKESVFQKFYRSGSEETRKTKGTGLGLYLVKNIVIRHHGTIRIEDNQPCGTRFVIRFDTASV